MSDQVPDVLLVTGPAGAGKTAVARRWALTRPYRCAHIALDDVRRMVKSGYADPREGWGDEQRRQFELARASVASLARRFIEAEVRCVIDDAIFPYWPFEEPGADYTGWDGELRGTTHRLLVLLPSLDTVLNRNAARREADRLDSEMMTTIYNMMTPWRDRHGAIVIDNSSLSVDDTVSAMETALFG